MLWKNIAKKIGAEFSASIFSYFALVLQYLSVAGNPPNHENPTKSSSAKLNPCARIGSSQFATWDSARCPRRSPDIHECNKEGPAAKFCFCDDLRGFMYTESAANPQEAADSSENQAKIAPRMLHPCARICSSSFAPWDSAKCLRHPPDLHECN